MSLSHLVSLVSNKGEVYASALGYFCSSQQQQGTNALKSRLVCSLNHLFRHMRMLNIATTF